MDAESSVKMLKGAAKEGDAIIGLKSVARGLKDGSIKTVFTSSNCPEQVVKEVTYYAKISKAAVQGFSGSSVELGRLCGKPFKVAIVGLEK
jgi:large subunit ribosomal protein L30e